MVLVMWRWKDMIRKITSIKIINPIAKEAWKKKYTIIPNKKKIIPRKSKYRQEQE